MKSEEVNANDAIIAVEEMATVSEISAYVLGDSRKTVVQAAQAKIDELNAVPPVTEPVPDVPKDLRAFEKPYRTIVIPKGTEKNDQKTVRVKITGTLEDGSNYEFDRLIRRGMKEHNVPANVIQMINDAILTEYSTQEKADKTGNELVAEQKQRWTVQVMDTYDVKKTEEEVKAELGIK